MISGLSGLGGLGGLVGIVTATVGDGATLLGSYDLTDVASFTRAGAAGYTGSGDADDFQREAAADTLRSSHYQDGVGPLVILEDSPTACSLVAPGTPDVTPDGLGFTADFAAIPVTVSLDHYEWRLDGAGDWTDIGTSTSISSTSTAGSHVLNVRAVSTSGVAGATATSASFDLEASAGGSDDFESYSDGSALDDAANWVNVSADQFYVRDSGGKYAHPKINAGSERVIRHTATLNANMYAEGTLAGVAANNVGVGPAVRAQSGADTWYAAMWYASNDTIYLIKRNAGGATATITSAGSHPLANGYKLRIEATGTGSSTRITVKKDTGSGWVAVFSSVDPGGTYIDGGFAGMVGIGTTISVGLDNFASGNI